MKGYIITTGSITYAIKGRDLLRKNNFKVKIERINSDRVAAGCGYAIKVEKDGQAAVELLKNAGIKILNITEK